MTVCSKRRDHLNFTLEMVKKNDRAEELRISSTSRMNVSQQYWVYTFIGETAGFVARGPLPGLVTLTD